MSTLKQHIYKISGWNKDLADKMASGLFSMKQLTKNAELLILVYEIGPKLAFLIRDEAVAVESFLDDDISRIGEEKISRKVLETLGLPSVDADILARNFGTYAYLACCQATYIHFAFKIKKDLAIRAVGFSRLYSMAEKNNQDLFSFFWEGRR